MSDIQYAQLPSPARGLSHGYGDRVHLLSDPWSMSLLARLCQECTVQPEVNRLVGSLYERLLVNVAGSILLRTTTTLDTRMKAFLPQGQYTGQIIDPDQRVVIVDLARAGILPSHRFYEGLHQAIEPENLRQDHVVASRTTDAEGRVQGVRFDASKIGGPIDGAAVLFPDPMGATGSSIAGVIDHYLSEAVGGIPRVLAAIHLIVTPEYLRRMTTEYPQLEIFAVRLDRGLSAPEVLQTPPGTRWEEERGLNDIQYIVPGAGGVGEVLNNAWV
jgi:uracil phosphoribosyltransferase